MIKSNIIVTVVIIALVFFCPELFSQTGNLQSSKLKSKVDENTTAKSKSFRRAANHINKKGMYRSELKRYGINDYRTNSLIHLLDKENQSGKIFILLLLGEREEKAAIPKLEEKLHDSSFLIRLFATKALLKMNNRKGIPALEDFSETAFAEIKEGNYKNLFNLRHTLNLLADAGEASAIPYLEELLKFERKPDNPDNRQTILPDSSYIVRINSMRSLFKLREFSSTIVADIEEMLNDKSPRVRKEAVTILKRCDESDLSPETVDLIKKMGKRDKILRYKKRLKNPSYDVQLTAAFQLLEEGEREGVPVFLKFCDKALAEIKGGNFQHVNHLNNSLNVLSHFGETSAIPYLRNLLDYSGKYSFQIKKRAINSLKKLYIVDSTVIEDIKSMLNDENPEVRKIAALALGEISNNNQN